eukprot:6178200-Pleurochrysis_carterae.AAC.5
MGSSLKKGSSGGRRRAGVEEKLRFAAAVGAVGSLGSAATPEKTGSATAPAACARELLWQRSMRVRLANY